MGLFFSFKVGQKFKYCQKLRGDSSKSQHISSTNQGCSEDRLTPIQTEPRHAIMIKKSNSGRLGRGISRQVSKDKPRSFVY